MSSDSKLDDMRIGDVVKRLSVWQVLGVVAITLFLGAALDCGGGNGAYNLTRDRSVEAMTVGQDAIRQRLRFPSTASFSEHKYGELNSSEYYYTALVRAENGFGNKVPSYWHVVVAFQPGTADVSQIVSVTQTQ